MSVPQRRVKRSRSSPRVKSARTGRLPFCRRRSMMPGMATLIADSMCDDSYSSCGRQSISSSLSFPSSSCSLSHATVLLIAISDAKGTGLSVSIMGVEVRERAGCLADAPRGRHRPITPREAAANRAGLNSTSPFPNRISGWGRRVPSAPGCGRSLSVSMNLSE